MAENEIVIDAPREQVFAILADADRYAEWVIGAARVRDADSTWPAPGSRLYHSSGAGPFTIDDSTEVVDSEPPGRLLLLAHLGPVGSFRVELVLRDEGRSTHVTMHEVPTEGLAKLAGPVGDAVGGVRNKLSLARLKDLAEA